MNMVKGQKEKKSRGAMVWGDLPPVMQARIFNCLPDKER